jgi:5'-3' exonuclease
VTLLALDTATIYYRNYFALPETMTAPDGFPNNAVRGTLTMLGALVDRWRTVNIAACWDGNWRPAWRVDLIPGYKEHRLADESDEELEPDTLGPQVGALAEILDALGVFRPSLTEYEADDVIASLVHASPDAIVVTSDRDLVQVIRGNSIRLHLMVNGGMDAWPVLTADAAKNRYGVPPERYVDMAVLRGDPSDGLPGVPGIGPKTAVALIDAFGTLSSVIGVADAPIKPMTPRQGALIREHADMLRAAEKVATAVADLAVKPKPWQPKRVRARELATLTAEWGVQTAVERLRAALQTQYDAAP